MLVGLNSPRRHAGALLSLLAYALFALPALAQQTDSSAKKDSAVTIVGVKVVSVRGDAVRLSPIQLTTLPNVATITPARIVESVNLMDVEDAVKYMPSVFLRKRNNGDTQAVLATRVWGPSSSARSLVFADGVPLTALVANNNTIGGPRWGLVGPSEIARIDMMYGPFSAAYSGSSMGAVMEITTRLPTQREGSITQTYASQSHDLYGTKGTFGTAQTTANYGDRFGKFAFWVSGNYQKSNSQPLAYVTAATIPSGTAGAFPETNKLGAAANVLGATGLLNTGMTNGKVKLAYDVTPTLRAAYTFGYWKNDATSNVAPYITKAGAESYAGQAGFATGVYHLLSNHSSHNVTLRTNNLRGDWDFEAVATRYKFDKDQQRSPLTASSTDLSFGAPGRLAMSDGTGWTTLDAKGVWHAGGVGSTHMVSFGIHRDQYELANPTYNTAEWTAGAVGSVASQGDGKTRTQAAWAQDAWRLLPSFKLTYGVRAEDWRAFDGLNINGDTKVKQKATTASRISPKAVLNYTPDDRWSVSLSAAKAYRFPTTGELYQLVTTGTTFTSPNPDLKPDDVLSTELRVERRFEGGRVQIALFNDDIHDAIISQFLPLVAGSSTLFSYLSNVDHVRATGVEALFGVSDVFVKGLEFSMSATYLDARILALSGRASATAAAGTAVGKFLPNIPRWRGTFATLYRPTTDLSFSLAGRYSDKLYTTLDNADVHFNTYQGFDGWFVADAKALYKFRSAWTASVGVDNLLNRKYFLFHPFPQRTLVGSVGYAF